MCISIDDIKHKSPEGYILALSQLFYINGVLMSSKKKAIGYIGEVVIEKLDKPISHFEETELREILQMKTQAMKGDIRNATITDVEIAPSVFNTFFVGIEIVLHAENANVYIDNPFLDINYKILQKAMSNFYYSIQIKKIMQNKVSLETIKTWFWKTQVTAPSQVPTHFFEYVHSLGLIDEDLDPDDMRDAAISECFILFEFALNQLEPQFARLVKKKRLSKAENAQYEALLAKVQSVKMQRGYFAQFATAGVLHEDIKALYEDMYQRAQVFYSKPLSTISDLGDVDGVEGAPTE